MVDVRTESDWRIEKSLINYMLTAKKPKNLENIYTTMNLDIMHVVKRSQTIYYRLFSTCTVKENVEIKCYNYFMV